MHALKHAPSYLSSMCQPIADNAGRRHLYAQLRVVILLFQSQGQSATVLAASLWQDRPRGTLFQYRYAAACHLPSSFRRDLKTELFIRAARS